MRHAVYFVPGDGSALARFGQALLGRDAEGRPVAALAGQPETPSERVGTAARYGFHATLKAPFRLAAGHEEGALDEALGTIARRHAPCALATLAPRRLGDYVALTLAEPIPALDALAADCLRALDGFRAPLGPEERARREREGLDADARARLDRWGYPYVLEGFRFHLTLGRCPAKEDPEERWIEALGRHYRRVVDAGGSPPLLDRLTLCREAAPGAPFLRVAEHRLEGRAADDGGERDGRS